MTKKIIIVVITLLLLSALYLSRVDNTITFEDKKFITDYFIKLEAGDPYKTSYEEQLNLIKSIQHSVFVVAPTQGGIDKRNTREPKDLYLNKAGLCFDRSRVIEKILRYYGFKTRHISIYSTKNTGSIFKSLVTPGINSHALSEVLTSKGWLVVDSNAEWLAIDKNKEVVTEKLLNNFPSIIYMEDFFVIYGLYSRHGMYYPPYNFIPDINYSEFINNFI
jgi:hypothetical protein